MQLCSWHNVIIHQGLKKGPSGSLEQADFFPGQTTHLPKNKSLGKSSSNKIIKLS